MCGDLWKGVMGGLWSDYGIGGRVSVSGRGKGGHEKGSNLLD